MSYRTKIVLAKPADWDVWISLVRCRAWNNDIWHLVNPDLVEKPHPLSRPVVPTFVLPQAGTPLEQDAVELYKLQVSLYKIQLGEFNRQKRAFGELVSFIQETISAYNSTLIREVEFDPWDMLRALKNRLAPSDHARSLEVERNYHKLCKGPGTQELEIWLDEWVATFTRAKELAFFEVDGIRPIRDFLLAARLRETSFAEAHLARLDEYSASNFYDLIEKFRQHLHRQRPYHYGKGGTHSSFSTNSGPSFKGKQVPGPPKPCLCGNAHWLADCYYLVPEKRPRGWKPKADKQKLVEDALKNSRTKTWVERTLEKRKVLGTVSKPTD